MLSKKDLIIYNRCIQLISYTNGALKGIHVQLPPGELADTITDVIFDITNALEELMQGMGKELTDGT